MTVSHPYSLRTVATFSGPMEVGWIASLRRGDRRVAHVVDQGDGEALVWHWGIEGDEHELDRHVAGLPPFVDARHCVEEWCRDAFALHLRREERERGAMRRYAGEQTVLQLPGIDGWGEWLVLDTPHEAKRAAALARRHGARVLAPRGKRL